VNIGDTLEALSGNQIKATKHRVMDIGIERFSSPFFFDPKYSARVPTDCLISSRKFCEDFEFDSQNSNKEDVEKLQPYGDWLCKKMTNAYGEWKNFEIPNVHYDYSQKSAPYQ
jgi:isopenicillin N synthase-like dioxygenase